MNRAILKQALEALESASPVGATSLSDDPADAAHKKHSDAIAALKAELTKPEPQPIAYLKFWAYQSVSPDGGVEADEGLEVCGRTEIGADGLLAKPVYLKEQL